MKDEGLDLLLVILVYDNYLDSVDTEAENDNDNNAKIIPFLKYTASHMSDALKSINDHYQVK